MSVTQLLGMIRQAVGDVVSPTLTTHGKALSKILGRLEQMSAAMDTLNQNVAQLTKAITDATNSGSQAASRVSSAVALLQNEVAGRPSDSDLATLTQNLQQAVTSVGQLQQALDGILPAQPPTTTAAAVK